jgi:hypothetical protein
MMNYINRHNKIKTIDESRPFIYISLRENIFSKTNILSIFPMFRHCDFFLHSSSMENEIIYYFNDNYEEILYQLIER